jgi:glycosyltransferase involved in cell wall biosynthesis
VYVGSLNRNRGSTHIIEALSFLPSNFEYHLDVVGSFPEERGLESDIMSAVQPVAEHVTFHGRVEYPVAVEIMSRADIGLICTQPTVNDLSGLPLKLFEYMAAGLGVIVSDFPLWHQYVNDYPACELVDPTNPERIAEGIVELANSLHTHAGVLAEAVQRIIKRYNWESEGQKLLRLYSTLVF